jgi:transmembrane sensor
MAMIPPTLRRLSRYVEPHVDEARLARMWSVVGPHRARFGSVRRFALVAAAASLALLIGVVMSRRSSGGPTLAGTVLDTERSESLTFLDGTRVTLHPVTRVRWDRAEARRVELTLERGEIELDVAHLPARAFVIHAGDFDVVDKGTRFVVALVEGQTQVSVLEGSVEVQRRGTRELATVLGAGETWMSAAPPLTSLHGGVDPSSSEPAPSAPRPPLPVPPGSEEANMAAGASPTRETNPKPAPGPRELLAAGDAANVAGHPRDAAAAFDALRKRYRNDRRAGLAAFELGRLRLDAFGDPASALEALDDAIDLAPDAGFREDAEARRIEALDKMRSPRCGAARAAYLTRYPSGLHASAVSSHCPP